MITCTPMVTNIAEDGDHVRLSRAWEMYIMRGRSSKDASCGIELHPKGRKSSKAKAYTAQIVYSDVL